MKKIFFKMKIIKKEKLENIKQVIHESLLETTIQGIPNLVRSEHSSLKIIWLIMLLIATCCCIYYVQDSVNAYLEHETVTTIKSFYQDIVPFPAVSICNTNFNLSLISFLNFRFNSNQLDNWQKHIEPFNDSYYGLCYKFNSGFNYNKTNPKGKNLIKNSTFGGFLYGLWMDLYLPSDYDLNHLKIFIHNQTLKPISIYNKGYFIASGTYNYFGIERVSNMMLGEPYNDCLEDFNLFTKNKTLINYFNENNLTYSYDECIKLCMNLIYIESDACNCSISLNDDFYNCHYSNDATIKRECTQEFLKSFQNKFLSSKCSQYCPYECTSTSYIITHYLEPILAKGKINKNYSFEYNQFNTYENVTRTFFSLFIYYENLKQTVISQKPKLQIFDLISNIGGLFGLFLGISYILFD